MRERILEYLRLNWIEITGVLVLILVVFFFASEIKDFIGMKKNKTEFAPVTPVDFSKDRDVLSCLKNRVAPEVIDFCTEAFKE